MKKLAWFTPWPPMQNGIADYSYRVARELGGKHQVTAYTDMLRPRLPPGVGSKSLEEARSLPEDVCPVFQVGNNLDHGFVFQQALQTPGIVVLHDLSLLYLVENLGLDAETFFSELTKANPVFAPMRAAKIASGRGTQKSDHSIFRMLNTLVDRSRRVVVHTNYAKNLLVKTLGDQYADRIRIIPHFAISPDAVPSNTVRARLGVPKDTFLVVTSGFATPVKRFDWLVEALARVARTNRRLMWVQAGPTRPDEYDLQGHVAKFPELARVTRFTGYLPEEDLDAYISTADLFVNLRYPSVGESSGSLARALATGAVCAVTDTAGYREFPDAVVFKVSPGNAAQEIEELLLRGMADSKAFDNVRLAAKEYALNTLSIQHYAEDFEHVIDEAMSLHQRPAEKTIFMSSKGGAITQLGPFDLQELEFGSLADKLPTMTSESSLRIRKAASGWYVEIIQ